MVNTSLGNSLLLFTNSEQAQWSSHASESCLVISDKLLLKIYPIPWNLARVIAIYMYGESKHIHNIIYIVNWINIFYHPKFTSYNHNWDQCHTFTYWGMTFKKRKILIKTNFHRIKLIINICLKKLIYFLLDSNCLRVQWSHFSSIQYKKCNTRLNI